LVGDLGTLVESNSGVGSFFLLLKSMDPGINSLTSELESPHVLRFDTTLEVEAFVSSCYKVVENLDRRLTP